MSSDEAIEVVGEVLPAPVKGKGGRPWLLCEDVQARVVAATHSGAFSWVAAVAAGISPQTYYRWMAAGKIEAEGAEERDEEPGRFGQFYLAVTKARAVARLSAERAVMKDNPLAWLLKGPGRDRPGEPGWSDKMEVTGLDGGPLHTIATPAYDLSKLSPKELDDLDALTSKALTTG